MRLYFLLTFFLSLLFFKDDFCAESNSFRISNIFSTKNSDRDQLDHKHRKSVYRGISKTCQKSSSKRINTPKKGSDFWKYATCGILAATASGLAVFGLMANKDKFTPVKISLPTPDYQNMYSQAGRFAWTTTKYLASAVGIFLLRYTYANDEAVEISTLTEDIQQSAKRIDRVIRNTMKETVCSARAAASFFQKTNTSLNTIDSSSKSTLVHHATIASVAKEIAPSQVKISDSQKQTTASVMKISALLENQLNTTDIDTYAEALQGKYLSS